MGTTAQARLKLRIRYVDPEQVNRRQQHAATVLGVGPASGSADVVSMADRRSRLTG